MFIKVRSQKSEVRSKKRILKKLLIVFYFLCSLFFSLVSNAQCAMCRAALAGEQNQAQAEAVNEGIVYLMAIPYLLVAGIGYAVYRMRKKKG
jgi:hypothetical protein